MISLLLIPRTRRSMHNIAYWLVKKCSKGWMAQTGVKKPKVNEQCVAPCILKSQWSDADRNSHFFLPSLMAANHLAFMGKWTLFWHLPSWQSYRSWFYTTTQPGPRSVTVSTCPSISLLVLQLEMFSFWFTLCTCAQAASAVFQLPHAMHSPAFRSSRYRTCTVQKLHASG